MLAEPASAATSKAPSRDAAPRTMVFTVAGVAPASRPRLA
jgi:hypothetical protein